MMSVEVVSGDDGAAWVIRGRHHDGELRLGTLRVSRATRAITVIRFILSFSDPAIITFSIFTPIFPLRIDFCNTRGQISLGSDLYIYSI